MEGHMSILNSNMKNTKKSTSSPEISKEINNDLLLPIANIARIMRSVLPKNAKIAKESKELVQECVSEFISFITNVAYNRCARERRKTVNGEDILYAMAYLGYDNYIEHLKMYLEKYREYSSKAKEEKKKEKMDD